MSKSTGIKPGDRVNWTYTPRGGYGLSMAIAAVVERVGPAFIQVRLAVRDPLRDRWHQEWRWVHPSRLSIRSLSVPVVDSAIHHEDSSSTEGLSFVTE